MTDGVDHVESVLRSRLSRRRVLGGLTGGATALAIAPLVAAAQAAAPQVGDTQVAANPLNVLSAVVTVNGMAGAAARVEFGSDGKFGERTPDFPLTGAGMDLPVLGLRPETDYTLRTVATGNGGKTATGQPMAFRTGKLPVLPTFEVRSPGKPEPGYTLLAPAMISGNGAPAPPAVVIIDAAGNPVWYRQTSAAVFDFQLQPNGHFTAALARSDPFSDVVDVGVYEEWDLLGNVITTWTVQGHPLTDFHEIRLVGDGQDALLFGYVSQKRDTRPFGGPADAPVWGHVLQRVTRAGEVTFEWNAFDHFKLGEADDYVWNNPNKKAGAYDWTHPNAIAIDLDGNYITSSRHFSELTKIDAKTGAVIWRMGMGRGNQFKFIDDPLNGFSMQHGVRVLPNGHIILFDNGNQHTPPTSRAAEYEVDEKAKTARLVWSYEPGIFGRAMGISQRLPGGNTLVTFGTDYRVIEVTPTGEVAWEARYPVRGWGATAWRNAAPGQGAGEFGIYRAFRIPSLYGVGQ